MPKPIVAPPVTKYTSSNIIQQALSLKHYSEDPVLDSSIISYFFNDLSQFTDYKLYLVAIGIGIGALIAYTIGTIKQIQQTLKDKAQKVILTKVYFVPDIVSNLLSTKALKDYSIFYRNEDNVLYDRKGYRGSIRYIAQVYRLNRLPYVLTTFTK